MIHRSCDKGMWPVTIVVSIKVHDGIVFACDSASTLTVAEQDGTDKVLNVWNHQNKLFNLRKGLPIGAITYGQGAIGHASISTLSKDLRVLLSGDDADWCLDADNYTMEEVATKARKFLFEQRFQDEYGGKEQQPGMLGYWVGGYSSHSPLAELWDISIKGGECAGPTLVRDQAAAGANWGGDPEAVSRLVLGHSETLPAALLEVGAAPETLAGVLDVIRNHALVNLVWDAMPIQDAIDLADFLVCAAISFARFRPGAETVGGPVEIAAITKHEGFRWVKRKHYFSSSLNQS